jgi:8-oxo-dGTP pyrophosphatase MutT (NUDIX family)
MADLSEDLALVRKNKPAWQAGRLNGIGGGVEPGELPLQAMCREWKEETGDDHNDWSIFASLDFGEGGIVHFFKAEVNKLPSFPHYNDIGEVIEVHNYQNAIRYTSLQMIQNLKWLLPLAFEDPNGLHVRNFGVAA